MGRNPIEVVVARIRTLVSTQQAKDQGDCELLRAYSVQNDQAAFGVLVKRHGPLVFAVCKRVLHHDQDAEDAFQAVFIVLAKKVASVCKHHSLAGWLHQVSHQIALAARRAAKRRRRHESEAKIVEPASPASQAAWREVQVMLEEEIQRLHDKYREPFVLCCLENLSCAEASRRIGLKEGTVWSRLAEARKRLQARLSGRGVTLSAALAAVSVSQGQAAAGLPLGLAATTVRGVFTFGRGARAAGLVSKEVAVLVRWATAGLLLAKVKVGIAMVLGLGALVGAVGWCASQDAPTSERVNPSRTKDVRELPALLVDPLPAGALARAGTLSFQHVDAINQVVFSPDGLALASVAQDGTMRVWDAATGQERQRFQNGAAGFWSVAYSPDGKTLASGEGNNTLGLWDVTSGRALHRFCGEALRQANGDQAFVSEVAFSPNGRLVASLSFWERVIRLRDSATGKELRQLQGNGIGSIRALAFSPDGKTLASGEAGGLLRIWDVVTGKEIRRFIQEIREGDDGLGGTGLASVIIVVFSRDGSKLATSTGYDHSTVHLYDVATGTILHKINVPGDSAHITLSPDGRMLATTTHLSEAENTIILWDVATGKELRRTRRLLSGLFSIAFAPDGKILASGSTGGRVQLWDVATCAELHPAGGQQGSVTSVAISPSGRLLASASRYDESVRLWDTATGKPLGQLTAHQGGFHSLAFSADGRTLATGGDDQNIRLWDVGQLRELRHWRAEGDVGNINLSPDGTALTSQYWPRGVGPGARVQVWNVTTEKETLRITTPAKSVGDVAISLDGHVMAAPTRNGAQSTDYSIHVWDLPTGRERRPLTGHTAEVWALTLSADGRFLVSKSSDQTIRLWELASGKEVWRAEEHVGPKGYPCLALSPNMRILATGGDDHTVHLWDLGEGKQLPALAGHQGSVRSLVFSRDGRLLVSGSDDSTVLVWNANPWAIERRQPRLELRRAWENLAKSDDPSAYQAMLDLAAMHKDAVPFLQKHMRPAIAVNPEPLAKIFVELDSKDFRVREAASKKLQDLGESAEPAMRLLLSGNLNPEPRARVSLILDALQIHGPAPETLRTIRAIGALERVATADARHLLESLAKGTPEARSTQEAKASLERLSQTNQ